MCIYYRMMHPGYLTINAICQTMAVTSPLDIICKAKCISRGPLLSKLRHTYIVPCLKPRTVIILTSSLSHYTYQKNRGRSLGPNKKILLFSPSTKIYLSLLL
jgi:hypothetical protein